ncbi:tryptophan transporter [Neobacillus muris]|uniref:tryptophan transporter n=1 Tax=Neobacillus muris TaxID=2941334 RepID=UPI0020414622|nr:tryptophan transporter [Neobacillus muris]
MNTKNLVVLALLAGIGVVLHTLMPAFLQIKPDMMLAMMFLGIVLIPNIKSAALMGIVTGILSALTTSFPGGQIPNIIDKVLTSLIIFGLVIVFKKYSNTTAGVAVLTAVGTIISGSIFLGSAFYIVGLPGPFLALFAAGVLPAVVINTIVMVILYPIARSIFKRTNLSSTAAVTQK